MLHSMFHLSLPVLEKILRAGSIYVFLVIALRFTGKRELTQLSSLDFVVLFAVANAVQNGIIGNDDSVTGGVIGAITLFALNFALAFGTYKWKGFRHTVLGSPTTLIADGRVDGKALDEEQLTVEDLSVAVQRSNADGLDDVQTCILLPSGNFAVELKPHAQKSQIDEITRKLDLLIAASGAL